MKENHHGRQRAGALVPHYHRRRVPKLYHQLPRGDVHEDQLDEHDNDAEDVPYRYKPHPRIAEHRARIQGKKKSITNKSVANRLD